MGFVLTPDEAQEWIAADARNAEVLSPYLNGEDLNSRPDTSPSRWAIDFNDWSEAEAAEFALPFGARSSPVKPERQRTKPDGTFGCGGHFRNDGGSTATSDRRFGRRSPSCLKCWSSLVSARPSCRCGWQPVRFQPSAVVVFATDDYGAQAVLSSSLHQLWAITYGSGMRNDPRYTPSDVFETFPRPTPTERLGRSDMPWTRSVARSCSVVALDSRSFTTVSMTRF